MFTGLIEEVGDVLESTPGVSGSQLRIGTPLAAQLHAGDSIAVNGVCLTVASRSDAGFRADVGPETARVTTLGGLRPGQRVNLERPMRADGRFGGHFVQGHVDGTGAVREVREDGDSHWITIGFPRALEPFLISRGSIAVDGVSLTVAHLGETNLELMIVPFTWTHSSLSSLRVGDRVNLECDMIGKYVARSLALADRVG